MLQYDNQVSIKSTDQLFLKDLLSVTT